MLTRLYFMSSSNPNDDQPSLLSLLNLGLDVLARGWRLGDSEGLSLLVGDLAYKLAVYIDSRIVWHTPSRTLITSYPESCKAAPENCYTFPQITWCTCRIPSSGYTPLNGTPLACSGRGMPYMRVDCTLNWYLEGEGGMGTLRRLEAPPKLPLSLMRQVMGQKRAPRLLPRKSQW
jgi:hypothetical protein